MLEGAYQPIDVLRLEDPAGDVRPPQGVLNESRVAVNLTVAKDGLGAIERLYQRKGYTGAIRPDMILLDLNLPKMADRLALQEIKSDAVPMRLPGIFLTPFEAESDILATDGAHANCYITKPADMDNSIDVGKRVEELWFTIVMLPNIGMEL